MEIKIEIPTSNEKFYYYICPSCKRPVWMNQEVHDINKESTCPFCKFVAPSKEFILSDLIDHSNNFDSIISISFKKSPSKNFKQAASLAKILPHYSFENNLIHCEAKTIEEVYKNLYYFFKLIHLIEKWNNAQILLYGKKYKYNIDFIAFINRASIEAGKYERLFHSYGYCCSEEVTYEKLPLPFVFYSKIFLAFASDIDGELFLCECEREAVNSFFTLYQEELKTPNRSFILNKYFPKNLVNQLNVSVSNLINQIRFKEHICFKCNKKTPNIKYCHPMYGGIFMQQNGWYVEQEKLKYGITSLWETTKLTEKCPITIANDINTLHELRVNQPKSKDLALIENHSNICRALYKKIEDAIQNEVRTQLGYKKIGESWIGETSLFNIVKGIFTEDEVLMHYRPQWLNGLELDIYVPSKNIAFEYQGIQHIKPVKHWGGKEKLLIQQEHDKRKKKICEDLGVKLICVFYDEPLTTEYILGKIYE